MVPGPWTTRAVDAPAGDMLSRSEVAKLFGVSESTISRLVEEGEFPTPLTVGKQTKVWDWEAVAYYRLRLRLGGRVLVNGTQPTSTDVNDPPKPVK